MAKAYILGDAGKVTEAIDIRGGKAANTEADAFLHKRAGALLLDWWTNGDERNRSAPNFWTVQPVIRGQPIQIDLREPFLRSAVNLGINHLPKWLRLSPEGYSLIMLPSDQYTEPDYAEIGAAFHSWNDDARPARVGFELHDRFGSVHHWKPDIRPLLNQVLRMFVARVVESRQEDTQDGGEAKTTPEA